MIPDEFKDQKALVIGGGRGLGEVTSKLLAAGGARIILTFYKGSDDAQRVVDEIVSGGGKAESIYFNVLAPAEISVGQGMMSFLTHLYYFATPHISARKGPFSAKIFRTFCDYYVSGFSATLEFLLKQAPTINKIFYPSSVFVEEPPLLFKEYVAAKAAGEALCSFLEKSSEKISSYKARLPKMATDQTVSLMGDDSVDPVPVMLNQLREFGNYTR